MQIDFEEFPAEELPIKVALKDGIKEGGVTYTFSWEHLSGAIKDNYPEVLEEDELVNVHITKEGLGLVFSGSDTDRLATLANEDK
jgi:hypothetical protein